MKIIKKEKKEMKENKKEEENDKRTIDIIIK